MNKLDLLLKGKEIRERFCQNHPQFPAFLHDVEEKGITEGTDVTIAVTFPDGQVKKAGLHIKPADMELFALLRELQ